MLVGLVIVHLRYLRVLNGSRYIYYLNGVGHDISFVIVARGFQELGYQASLGPPNIGEMNSVPFLRRVYMSKTMLVYEVTAVGTAVAPESPLLRGPYLHCLTSPVHI